MYIFVGVLLTIFSIVELSNKRFRKSNFVFYVLSLVLTVMLCLRYGQGTDYIEYQIQFQIINPDVETLVNQLEHGELGWFLMLLFFKKIGFNFDWFIIVLSLVMMTLTIKSIKRYSPYKILSLLLLYPTYFLTYYYSALRQGLVLCLFIFFGIKLLLEKKLFRYFLLVIVLCLFHFSAFLLFFVPLVFSLKKNVMLFLFIVAFMLSIIIGYSGLLTNIFRAVGIHTDYLKIKISVQAIALRVIIYGFVYYLYSVYLKHCVQEDLTITHLFNFYSLGLLMFLLFSFSSNLSQRVTMPLKAIEILLIPLLLSKIRLRDWKEDLNNKSQLIHLINMSSAISILLIVIMNIELVKNIYSYIDQGNYLSWVNPINYPYISIFNKDKIWDYISEFNI